MTSEGIATLARETATKGVAEALAAAEPVEDALSWAQTLIVHLMPHIASALASVAQERETELKRLQRVADYHAECRPNREEAEAAIAEFERLRAELAQAQTEIARLKDELRLYHSASGIRPPTGGSGW